MQVALAEEQTGGWVVFCGVNVLESLGSWFQLVIAQNVTQAASVRVKFEARRESRTRWMLQKFSRSETKQTNKQEVGRLF